MVPFKQFTKLLTEIAEAVKSFGGTGKIHGAIVDIDYYNHIYVNPFDLVITPYWAENIINKMAYPSISALLKARCPNLYVTYKKMDNNDTNKLILAKNTTTIKEVIYYPDTDIYRASREVKKMQRLHSNILTVWTDSSTKKLSDKTNNS